MMQWLLHGIVGGDLYSSILVFCKLSLFCGTLSQVCDYLQAAAMKAVSNAYESCSVPGILEIPGGFKSKLTGLTLKLCRAYTACERDVRLSHLITLQMHIRLLTCPAAVPAAPCSKRLRCPWHQCSSLIVDELLLCRCQDQDQGGCAKPGAPISLASFASVVYDIVLLSGPNSAGCQITRKHL